MDGQTVDFTAGESRPTPVRVGAVDGPEIDWSPAPPVRVVESRAPRSMREIEPGVWVVDFGQNASGWIRLTDLGPAGHAHRRSTTASTSASTGTSRPPTSTPSDRASRRALRAARRGRSPDPVATSSSHATPSTDSSTRGSPRHGAPLDPASVTMQIVHTDLRRTGTFACSDDDLNRLHEIAEWSFRGNAVDVPTDCPTRERLAWTGDYQIFAPTATRLYDVLGFSRKWLRSVRDDQLDDGRIANFSPDGRRIKHHLDDQFAMMTGSAGWGDAIVAVPWELYESYGDDAGPRRELGRDGPLGRVGAREGAHRASPRAAQQHPKPEPFEEYLWDGTFHWGEWTEPKERDADGTPIDPIKQQPDGVVHGRQGRGRHRLPLPLDRDPRRGSRRSSATTTPPPATRAPPSGSGSPGRPPTCTHDGTHGRRHAGRATCGHCRSASSPKS